MRFLLLTLLLFPLPVLAMPMPGGMERGETVIAAESIDGDTIRLKDGRELRLLGLLAPKGEEPLAQAAKRTLGKLVAEKRLTLASPALPDRYGRLQAHAALADTQTWIEAEMIGQGLARVFTMPDAAQGAADLLALEGQARTERKGLWADRRYQVIDSNQHISVGRFEVVEGKILSIGKGTGRTYLNFGSDWKTDFTVVLDSEASRLFRKNRLTAKKLEGQRVRVRGLVILTNGPMIEASHPEQMELLDLTPEKSHKSPSKRSRRKPTTNAP